MSTPTLHFHLTITTSSLDSAVIGDKKWTLYADVTPGLHVPVQPETELQQIKMMLSVWWDVDGVILLELLPHTTITASVYYQLQQLKADFPP